MDKYNLCQELCNSYGRILYSAGIDGLEGDPYLMALTLSPREIITYEKSTGKFINSEFIVLECEGIVIKIGGNPLVVEGYVNGTLVSHYDMPAKCTEQFWEIAEEFWNYRYEIFPYFAVLEENDTTAKVCY